MNGPGSSTLTIGNTVAAAPGNYSIDITGTYSGGSQTNTVGLNVANQPGGVPTLLTPANNAVNVVPTPTSPGTQPPRRPATASIWPPTPVSAISVHSASGLTGASYTPVIVLNTSVTYYWRVYADNACGSTGASPTFSFTSSGSAGRL